MSRTSVGVDLRGLPEAVHKKLDGLGLEKRVVLRLVQEGFAVVAPAAHPEVLVRLAPAGPKAIAIDVSVRGVSRRRRVSWRRGALPEVHLEIAQKAVGLVRSCLRLAPDPPPVRKKPPKPKAPPPKATPIRPKRAPPRPPRVTPRPAAPPKKPATPPAPGRFELRGGLATLYRGFAFDPLLWGELRIRLRGGFGVRLASGFAPVSGGGITANELQLQLGAGYRIRLVSDLDLEAGLLVGLLAHFWSLDPESGSTVDALVSLPLSLTWWLRPWFALEVRLVPGIADSSRAHSSAGQTVWRREALRLEGGIGLVFRIP